MVAAIDAIKTSESVLRATEQSSVPRQTLGDCKWQGYQDQSRF